jgi:hypothetical protein
MIAASPNWRSKSTSSVRRPPRLASAEARFADRIDLPVPPLGENTVITCPVRGRASRRAARTAFSIAKSAPPAS